MKKFAAVLVLLMGVLPAFAVQGNEVRYVGGTVTGLEPGVVGRFDMSPSAALMFEHNGGKVAIPYADITSFDYSKEVAHHLGVLPAIAISLVKMRTHRHFFRISYKDATGEPQVAVFEVPKQMPRVLKSVIETRTPHSPSSPGKRGHAEIIGQPK